MGRGTGWDWRLRLSGEEYKNKDCYIYDTIRHTSCVIILIENEKYNVV